MSTDIVEQLLQNSHFVLMLKDQVQKIVCETITERTQTKFTRDMIDQINDLLSKIIQFNIKQEVNNTTTQIQSSLMKLQQEGERNLQQFLERIQDQHSSFQKKVQQTIKDIKKDAMDDRLRIEQKICHINKNSTQTITNKIRDITNNFDQNFPKSMKSIKMIPFSTKQLPELDSTVSSQLKSTLKQFQNRIQQIQDILIDIENRLHQRYQTNITSLWTVVADLQDKIITEDKVESKLQQIKGSIISISSQIVQKQKPKIRTSSKFKKWFNIE